MRGDAPMVAIELRAALPTDYDFARGVHHAGMRWIAERLFGWDDAAQAEKFARQFVLAEARVIVMHDQREAGSPEGVAYSSISWSPSELPNASSGRLPRTI